MRLVSRVVDYDVITAARQTFKVRKNAWSQIISLATPLYESREIISFGGRAYLITGGIGPHFTGLLVPKGKPLSLGDLFLICAQASFFVDGAVVPRISYEQRRRNFSELTTLNALFKKAHHQGVDAYFQALESAAETCDDLFAHVTNGGARVLEATQRTKWLYCDLPSNDNVKRALFCYWSALLTLPVGGRIINFWRAFEAIANTPQLRATLFSDLPNGRLAPIYSLSYPDTGLINLMLPLRRRAVARRKRLLATHGTADAAVRFLHALRRGKAAHADQVTLEYDYLSDLRGQFEDAELMRYMARVAIEKNS